MIKQIATLKELNISDQDIRSIINNANQQNQLTSKQEAASQMAAQKQQDCGAIASGAAGQ